MICSALGAVDRLFCRQAPSNLTVRAERGGARIFSHAAPISHDVFKTDPTTDSKIEPREITP